MFKIFLKIKNPFPRKTKELPLSIARKTNKQDVQDQKYRNFSTFSIVTNMVIKFIPVPSILILIMTEKEATSVE